MKIGWPNLILTIPSLAFIVCFEITGYYDLFFFKYFLKIKDNATYLLSIGKFYQFEIYN